MKSRPIELQKYFLSRYSATKKGSFMEPPSCEDVNLIKNPERNTGYNGSHIWQASWSLRFRDLGFRV